ncbi:MAG: phage portal protein [Bacteroidaceae bacterium]
MSLISYIKDFFTTTPITVELTEEQKQAIVTDSFKSLAFYNCVNLVANSISKCKFKTFENNVEVKKEEYYSWNIEPNHNQNSSEFMHDLITRLYEDNEALVVVEKGELYVANTFNRAEYTFTDDIFTQVSVKLESLKKTYKQSDVLYFKLSDTNMRGIANAIYNSYGELLAYTMSHYKISKGVKGVLNVEMSGSGTEAEKVYLADLLNKRFKNYYTKDNNVLPLSKGFEYKEIPKAQKEDPRDIRSIFDDISDYTARAFGIPPALLSGNLVDNESLINSYLTFCIDPLVDLLQEEINRKRSGYKAFSQGTYIKIDTRNIKHIDILDSATAIDKLIASGVYSINSVLELLGEETIKEDYADNHYITKNYNEIDEMLQDLEE